MVGFGFLANKMLFICTLVQIVIVSTFGFHLANCDLSTDCYWRDYTGNIPEDALNVGFDINGNPIYVGQAFFKDAYLQVVRIYQNNKEVAGSYGGVRKTDTDIKIMCVQNPERFKWEKADGKNLQVTTIGKRLVKGGSENGYALNIGRMMYQGELIVGKVVSYRIGDAKLYFPYKNEEKSSLLYEILVYDESADVVRTN